ncbi:hypothetical protein SAMN05443667_10782 [Flavobacterium gillisiae]|uniref:DUF4412 domain-containing protein n=1 Tax=Flavobacterium gillisiae TaxID=150146 RepID=A0A1H4D7Y5_9FLAO|nr:hypothetical protein [Flavobacterium gillisiae]SEA68372.1 hypothetical protein SAMN05443667_10782 [Flavobacterium gillisiae]
MKHLLIVLLTLSSLSSFASNKSSFPADTTQISNKNVLYKVSQDDNYVYLNISTTDRKTAMSIIRNGLTIYYDIKGKEKKNVYVKYPYSNESRPFQQGSLGNIDVNAIDLNSMIKKLPAEAEYGSFEEKQAFNKDLNTLDIAIANHYTASSQLFEFSIKTPKAKIASQESSDFSKLSIGVVANKMEGTVNKERGQGQNQGMRSGGGRRGNGSGGGRGGARGQNEQQSSPTTERGTVDFWFDAE